MNNGSNDGERGTAGRQGGMSTAAAIEAAQAARPTSAKEFERLTEIMGVKRSGHNLVNRLGYTGLQLVSIFGNAQQVAT